MMFNGEIVKREDMEMVTINSSNGTLKLDVGGNVIPSLSDYKNDDLVGITKFDFTEYRKWYPNEELDTIDILDIGYWTKNGQYEPPCYAWRFAR
jgi:hypothetical protein